MLSMVKKKDNQQKKTEDLAASKMGKIAFSPKNPSYKGPENISGPSPVDGILFPPF